MKQARCPVCNNNKFGQKFTAINTHGKEILSHQEKFTYSQCVHCSSLILQNVRFDQKYYQKYYDFGPQKKVRGLLALIEQVIAKYSQIRKQGLLREYNGVVKNKIAVLDVGSGTGDFLHHLSDKYEGYGVELDEKEFKISKQKKLRIYNEDIIKKDFSRKKFAVITLWHVIEHIPESELLFKKIGSLLHDDGMLIVATPNINSKGFSFAKTEWFHFDAPRHVILFNQTGIEVLAKRHGLTVKKIICEKLEFPLDLFWSIKKSNHPLKYLYLLLYPFMKMTTEETLTYIIGKKT